MQINCQLRSNINIEESLRLSEYGLEKRPEWNFLWLKGLSLHKLGRHEEALAILQEVEDKWTDGYNKDLQKDLLEIKQAL